MVEFCPLKRIGPEFTPFMDKFILLLSPDHSTFFQAYQGIVTFAIRDSEKFMNPTEDESYILPTIIESMIKLITKEYERGEDIAFGEKFSSRSFTLVLLAMAWFAIKC